MWETRRGVADVLSEGDGVMEDMRRVTLPLAATAARLDSHPLGGMVRSRGGGASAGEWQCRRVGKGNGEMAVTNSDFADHTCTHNLLQTQRIALFLRVW